MTLNENRTLATGEVVKLHEAMFEKCYTEDEFEKLMEAALGSRKKVERLRNYCLVGLGGWCSCRTSEALGVRGRPRPASFRTFRKTSRWPRTRLIIPPAAIACQPGPAAQHAPVTLPEV